MQDKSPEHRDYWDEFYAGRASVAVPEEPSAFALWTEGRVSSEQTIVEFGFGNARDSFWFARQGHEILGFDFAPAAVRAAQDRADDQGVPGAFKELDLYDSAAVADAVIAIKDRAEQPVIYGRFLIHSLEHAGRHHLFDLAAEVLPSGGALHLEFRTGRDRDAEHVFGEDHFRIYLDPADVVAEIEERGGTIVHSEAGYGLAVYKTEDPHVARIVATWRP